MDKIDPAIQCYGKPLRSPLVEAVACVVISTPPGPIEITIQTDIVHVVFLRVFMQNRGFFALID